tara:strand:+ start:5020 stop:5235 length:216 start_codon:yes stop_codon:yes gene_type:complete
MTSDKSTTSLVGLANKKEEKLTSLPTSMTIRVLSTCSPNLILLTVGFPKTDDEKSKVKNITRVEKRGDLLL